MMVAGGSYTGQTTGEKRGVAIELPFPPRQLSPNARLHWRWTPERDEKLRQLHGSMSVQDVAEALGTTRGSVRARITRLGIRKRDDAFSEHELETIRVAYEAASFGEDIYLGRLVEKLGRPKTSISRQARLMGLSNIGRPKKRETKPPYKVGRLGSPELHSHMSTAARARIATHGHPRGMLGKRHTSETKQRMAKSTAKAWRNLPPETQLEYTDRSLKAKVAKYGRIAPQVVGGRSWKAGWREIGGKRHYFRSRWEANYARYLEWLKFRGDILDWQYEPETFWFEGIKRGVRSYLPDFRVHELNGDKPLHEVKGWMDARSKTTLKRMAKYHPQERIVLIREKEYRAISRLAALIGEWE